MDRIELLQGDITQLKVDAIVNAANPQMLGGGGVDGAIHRAAGAKLLAACREFPVLADGSRCPTGEARITSGFDLPARFVIHTVGPVWQGGQQRERELLVSCYQNAMQLGVCAGVRSIAFPAISCGVYCFPIDEAARISVQTIRTHLQVNRTLERISLVAFDQAVLDAWGDVLGTN